MSAWALPRDVVYVVPYVGILWSTPKADLRLPIACPFALSRAELVHLRAEPCALMHVVRLLHCYTAPQSRLTARRPTKGLRPCVLSPTRSTA